MHVAPTKDCALIDSIVRHPDVFGGDMLPPTARYIHHPNVLVVVAWEQDAPLGAFLFIAEPFSDEAEVHVAFLPEGRGEAVIAAVAALKQWLRAFSRFKRVRARPPTPYLKRMVERLGFSPNEDSYALEVG